ncbi:Hint domain-containing protein [Celeribacter marinus]|uniref:Hint domain-containing protein n=1 Tax=Celeribacter marinus TaxID=1397108 RepID=UPI003F6D97BA
MIVTTSTMVFIGTLPSIDPTEGNSVAENATAISGTYTQASGLEVVDIFSYDDDDSGSIYNDDFTTTDYVTYTQGGTAYSQVLDTTIPYNANVTEVDGTITTLVLVVSQMQNGDTFVVDLDGVGELDNLKIKSIELTTPVSSESGGYYTWHTISNSSVVCFAYGTLIDTPNGPRAVEQLKQGDLITTLDHAAQPIAQTITRKLMRPARNAPICIAPHALTAIGQPHGHAPLRISPQHRLLLNAPNETDWPSQVLIAARHLLTLDGVTQGVPFVPVSYVHLRLRRHEIIYANGFHAETLLLGAQTCDILGNIDVVLSDAAWRAAIPARSILNAKQARRFLSEAARTPALFSQKAR